MLYRLGRQIWQLKPFRWLLTVSFAAFFGIAAGHTVIALSGSVSVVEGNSMSPTYVSGERVYTAPISSPLLRGDVVLMDDGRQEYALKRIIGLPGETIHLWRGYVFINRIMVREPYLPKHTYTAPSQQNEVSVFELGDDQYFVLGDNRVSSIDSRIYGAVERSHIKSRVPMPDGILRPTFAAFTLPAQGKRTIRPLHPTMASEEN
jgi:signal peptidase I